MSTQHADNRETFLSRKFNEAGEHAASTDEMVATMRRLLDADPEAKAVFRAWSFERQLRERCAAWFREHHRTIKRQVAMATHGPVSAVSARQMPERPSMPGHMFTGAPRDTGRVHHQRTVDIVEYRGERLLDDVVCGVKLSVATREHLLASAELFEKRAKANIDSARLWRAIAGHLPEGGIVRDVLGARAGRDRGAGRDRRRAAGRGRPANARRFAAPSFQRPGPRRTGGLSWTHSSRRRNSGAR